DLVAENAYLEIAWYYIPTIHPRKPAPRPPLRRVAPGSCSAFVATRAWTTRGKGVLGHNNWGRYWLGGPRAPIFDVARTSGHRFIMDALPGFVHSGDDFYVSDAGLMVTETTITQFYGFDPLAIPEFVRARRAIQFADGIDAWIETMSRNSNGAYANDWLIGNSKTGEI